MDCIKNTDIVQPDNTPLECDSFSSDKCIIHQDSISYLSLPANSTQEQITLALLASLMNARIRISTLESIVEDLTERIEDLEA